jgi:hypothetical protein
MADDTRNLAIELIAMRATLQVMIATLERSGAPGLIEAIRGNIGNIIQGEALVLPASVAGRDVYVQEIREYALQIIAEVRTMAPPTDEELAKAGL